MAEWHEPGCTGALPLRPRDLTLSRQNDRSGTGRRCRPVSFRPLSRRSGCVPAEPYPPLRCFQSTENAIAAVVKIRRLVENETEQGHTKVSTMSPV